MKIATELHRPTWVSLPLIDAILRDDVLISFITPPELSPDPLFEGKPNDKIHFLFSLIAKIIC